MGQWKGVGSGGWRQEGRQERGDQMGGPAGGPCRSIKSPDHQEAKQMRLEWKAGATLMHCGSPDPSHQGSRLTGVGGGPRDRICPDPGSPFLESSDCPYP